MTENSQGVHVCSKHKDEYVDLKCICGEWVEVRSGKWGPYGVCPRCGNLSWRKLLEANPSITPSGEKSVSSGKKQRPVQRSMPKTYRAVKESKKEIVITSDEIDLM